MPRWVTVAGAEIADDLMLLRLGARRRWQTKRGVPGRFRKVDWMTLDANASLYPEADRDNFGTVAGLLNYDWRWHLGDRLTLASDGFADVFGDGLKTFTIGSFIARPESGSLYLGLRSIEGLLSCNVVKAAATGAVIFLNRWFFAVGT